MPDNYDRADWAETAVECFEDATGTDREDALCDLLCNLMHFADREGFDFNAELARARMHYGYEVKEDGGRCAPEPQVGEPEPDDPESMAVKETEWEEGER